ncbi:MAG: phage tail tape measure protein, partial [Candidatus Bipolaricaulota bacterium]
MNGGGNRIGVAFAEIHLNRAQFLADVRGAEGGFRQGATAMTQSANSVTSSLKNLVVAMGGLYVIQKVVRSAVDAFAGFDKELRNVWTLTNATWGEMQKLGAELRELAPQFGKTATEATRALYDIYSSGFQGAEAMSILKASATGAAAGLTDLKTSAAVTVAVLNAYKMTADKAGYVVDVLFKTVEKGVITYEELASTFGRLIGVAAPLGASLEEMAAAVAVLTKQGISADEAVTAVRAAIMSLASPTETTEKIIKELGFSSGEAMVRQLGFAESLKRVVEA